MAHSHNHTGYMALLTDSPTLSSTTHEVTWNVTPIISPAAVKKPVASQGVHAVAIQPRPITSAPVAALQPCMETEMFEIFSVPDSPEQKASSTVAAVNPTLSSTALAVANLTHSQAPTTIAVSRPPLPPAPLIIENKDNYGIPEEEVSCKDYKGSNCAIANLLSYQSMHCILSDAEAIYVRHVNGLNYFNKLTQEYIAILLDQNTLEKFDRDLKPRLDGIYKNEERLGYKVRARILSVDELNRIHTITGHKHTLPLPMTPRPLPTPRAVIRDQEARKKYFEQLPKINRKPCPTTSSAPAPAPALRV